MQLISGSRGSGKTEAIIKYAYDNDCVILVPCRFSVRIIKEKAKRLNLQINEPMVFAEYMNMKNDSRLPLNIRDKRIVVDELSICLSLYFKIDITAATGTLPTIHPQTYLLNNQLSSARYDNGDKYFNENVLGIWDMNK